MNPEAAPVGEDPNSVSLDQKIRTCVDQILFDYNKEETQALYAGLLKLTIDECEALLKRVPDEATKKLGVKGVVQGRMKKPDSLKQKLEDLGNDRSKNPDEYHWLKQKLVEMKNDPGKIPEESEWLDERLDELKEDPGRPCKFRNWVAADKDAYEHPEICDLAGVRIGLYFPDDIVAVVDKIKQHFNITHYFGTVTGGRHVVTERNLDIRRHLDGQWYDGDDHWENSGYKSWQMVAIWKQPLANRLKALGLGKERSDEDLSNLRVEIQVGTVVMQAWAEVQHNIIYKNPDEILATPAMKRMIDSVNGLAITTDIMLKELKEGLRLATVQMDEREFKDNMELAKWLEKEYRSQLALQQWRLAPKWCWHLLFVYRLLGLPTSRANFKRLIKTKGMLKHTKRQSERLDLSLLLLKDLGARSWRNIHEIYLNHTMGFPPEKIQPTMSQLLKFFFTACTWSFMLTILEKEAVKKLKERFSGDGVDKMRKIHAVLLLHQFEESEGAELEKFTNVFLEPNWCEEHDVALSLARRLLVITDDSSLRMFTHGEQCMNNDHEDWKSQFWPDISSALFRVTYGDVQGILFDCQRFGIDKSKVSMLRSQFQMLELLPRIVQMFYGTVPMLYVLTPSVHVDAPSSTRSREESQSWAVVQSSLDHVLSYLKEVQEGIATRSKAISASGREMPNVPYYR